jgi:predicted transcriptional regulator
MAKNNDHQLSRRERQIMDVLHQRTQATAAEVQVLLPDPPSYSTVRALLRILLDKGHIRHRREGARYVYLPRTSAQAARSSALDRVIATFFQGSVTRTMAALLEKADTELPEEDLQKLQRLIDKARSEGR